VEFKFQQEDVSLNIKFTLTNFLIPSQNKISKLILVNSEKLLMFSSFQLITCTITARETLTIN
jgi:hypothetical protein